MVREPVATVEELLALDDDDIHAGYLDGRAGEPEPGDNRSKAFWHGWRVGAADGGHRQLDHSDYLLVRAAAPRGVVDRRLTERAA